MHSARGLCDGATRDRWSTRAQTNSMAARRALQIAYDIQKARAIILYVLAWASLQCWGVMNFVDQCFGN